MFDARQWNRDNLLESHETKYDQNIKYYDYISLITSSSPAIAFLISPTGKPIALLYTLRPCQSCGEYTHAWCNCLLCATLQIESQQVIVNIDDTEPIYTKNVGIITSSLHKRPHNFFLRLLAPLHTLLVLRKRNSQSARCTRIQKPLLYYIRHLPLHCSNLRDRFTHRVHWTALSPHWLYCNHHLWIFGPYVGFVAYQFHSADAPTLPKAVNTHSNIYW